MAFNNGTGPVIGVGIALWVGRRAGNRVRLALGTVRLAIYLASLPILVGFAYDGFTFTWYLPDSFLRLFLYFAGLVQVMFLAGMGLLLVGVVAGLGALLKRPGSHQAALAASLAAPNDDLMTTGQDKLSPPIARCQSEVSVSLRLRMFVHGTFSRLLDWIARPLRSVLKGRAPALASVAAILEMDGRLLLLERSDGRGMDLPGGIVRWGESVEQAVLREVREETGLQVTVKHIIGVFSAPARDPRFGCVCIAYACDVVSGDLRASEEGRPAWIPIEQLPERLAFGNEAILAVYRSRELNDTWLYAHLHHRLQGTTGPCT